MSKKTRLGTRHWNAAEIMIRQEGDLREKHAQVQMGRELGLNPKRLGKMDNHDQEPWKMPLRECIEHLYLKRFRRERPDVVLPIQKQAQAQKEKKGQKASEKTATPAKRDTLEKPTQGPNTMKLGRNDPCPCGSGKKYKKCCLDKQAHPSQALYYRRLSEAHGRLVNRLIPYANRRSFN